LLHFQQTSPTSTTSQSEQEFVSGCENLIERIKLKQFDIDEMERLSNLPVSGLIKDGGRLLET
uniref:Uncharacterized protein n=1 Tax=Anisakis simplex TaxID=6269 RepID=A0A0M3J9M0_ANISI